MGATSESNWSFGSLEASCGAGAYAIAGLEATRNMQSSDNGPRKIPNGIA